MLDTFAEARERRRELESRPGYVEEILRAGAERLAPIAAETLRECHERMGLGPPLTPSGPSPAEGPMAEGLGVHARLHPW